MNIDFSHIAALGAKGTEIVGAVNNTALEAGYKPEVTTGIGVLIGLIIKTILGLIGIIFLIMIVYGGVMWLTSEGEEKKVGAARNMITQAVVGLIFTVAAFAITVFVTNALGSAAGFRP